MMEGTTESTGQIELAEQAAEQLFKARARKEYPDFEPEGLEQAQAAVLRLGLLLDELPGAIATALEAARESGELLSSDRLQGLSEMVQNADDVEATQVRFVLRPNELLLCHNGHPVRLRHVLGLATPWLSTKGDEGVSIGRFGVGLMTLRSLSKVMEVHCHPYHVRLGESGLSTAEEPELPPGLNEPGWTVFRVPLNADTVRQEELEAWLDRWGHSALLFLNHVTRVVLIGSEGSIVRELSLFRRDEGEISIHEPHSARAISRQQVQAGDGRSWLVYSEEASTPEGVLRARKATGETTPVAVALPLNEVDSGQIHAGLPVVSTRLPLYANAQFDPLASRRDVADTKWNESLIPLVSELWSRAAVDLFSSNPMAAWRAMPIPESIDIETGSPFVERLERAIVERAVGWLASNLSFTVPGRGEITLPRLAVAAQALEGILTEEETAGLAQLPATLPFGARDTSGTWRSVLTKWREAGAELPKPVSVKEALALLGDEARPVDRTISLVAAAVNEKLSDRLVELPCVVAEAGRHIVPPMEDSMEALAAERSILSEQLGVVTLIHPGHLGNGRAAGTVLEWLRNCGALVNASDDRVVVRRIAAAGKAGRKMRKPLTDEQVQALRGAFESLDPDERSELGPAVGQAILLDAYLYELRGRRRQRRSVSAHPADAYLSKGIDREPDGFAVAAERAPGIIWLHDRYARVIRSPAGRQGVGALKFLRLLGAETAPRLRQHPRLSKRFANERLGLPRVFPGNPPSRSLEMQALRATFTLSDRDCPELQGVIWDISKVRERSHRRKRAGSLLATMGRAWERTFSDFSEVDAANDYHTWQGRGSVPAVWLWDAGEVAWLDDESGKPRQPRELWIRTPGTEAIYGHNSPDFLHGDLFSPARGEALASLGVSGDPSRSELVNRLKELRDPSGIPAGTTGQHMIAEAGIVYRALAESLVVGTSTSDLTQSQLRTEFGRRPGLLLTDHGWLPSSSVFRGPPILGSYGAFAPSIEGAGPLWSLLSLREPGADECIDAIRGIARGRHSPSNSQQTILLESLRALARQPEAARSPEQRRKLTTLPLWTSVGWMRERPVFATSDSALIAGLKDRIALWEPGGELEQFRSLLNPLRVKEISAGEAKLVELTQAAKDEESTDFFRLAVQQLQEDLGRNEPELALSLKVNWDLLMELDVWIHPTLALSVPVEQGEVIEMLQCHIRAKVDLEKKSVFVRARPDLSTMDGAGRALAELFRGEPRRIAMAWRIACDRADAGREASPLELAEEWAGRQQAENEEAIRKRTETLSEAIAARHQGNRTQARNGNEGSGRQESHGGEADDKPPAPPRVLVEPEFLRLTDPDGRIEEGKDGARRKKGRRTKLVEPSPKSKSPSNRVPVREYSDLDKEAVGMELVKKVLGSDLGGIEDIRSQRGVGADAVDELRRFYELKVSAGAEPDQVTLTNAEVQRALSTEDFFLVVVSGVERSETRPSVRILVDPLKQLQPTDRGEITLSGVRSSTSLNYEFSLIDDTENSSAQDKFED